MLLASEVTNLLKSVVTKKVKTYDVSQTRVILAESLILDGLISVDLSEIVVTSADTGIDAQYYAVVEQSNSLTLSITMLQTASCYSQLEMLDRMSRKNKAFFRLNLIENGESRGAYSAHIISLGGLTSSMDDNVKTVTFGLRTKSNKQSNILTVTDDTAVREEYVGNARTYPLVD